MLQQRVRTSGLALLLLLCATGGVQAQGEPTGPDPAPADPGAEKSEAGTAAPAIGAGSAPAAFMRPLGRLASILGSVHFLRTLCGDANAEVWRDKMNELLTAQAPGEADRRMLIARFNGGYRAYESTYRKCTPAARLAVQRYETEGAALSREISARYGN